VNCLIFIPSYFPLKIDAFSYIKRFYTTKIDCSMKIRNFGNLAENQLKLAYLRNF